MTAIGRIRIAVLVATCALTLVAVPGCAMWPSKEEIAQADKKLEEADLALAAAKKETAALQREIEKAAEAQAKIDAQGSILDQYQARIALEMANASPEARPFLEAQYDAVRSQARGLRDQKAGIAESIARFRSQLADWQAETDSLVAAVAMREQAMEDIEARIKQSNDTVRGAVSGAGAALGTYFPPAAPFVSMVTDNLLPFLTLAGGVGGTYWAGRKRLRAKDATIEERTAQRDNAREVIAITERAGVENIVRDPAVKAETKKAIKAKPGVAAEYAIAKALA